MHSGCVYSLVSGVVPKLWACEELLWQEAVQSSLLCYNNCIIVTIIKSLFVSCISSMLHAVNDKMCTLDVWHALCIFWLAKIAPITNLLMYGACLVWHQYWIAYKSACNQEGTSKFESFYMQKMCMCIHTWVGSLN